VLSPFSIARPVGSLSIFPLQVTFAYLEGRKNPKADLFDWVSVGDTAFP
jgi:hypothetical protein